MSVASPFHGLSAFPPTPADRDGRVDTEALSRLLERLCDAGVASIGLLGSTGIYAFLAPEERRRAVEAQRGVRASINAGFNRVFWTLVDTHVAALISCS